MEDYIEINGKLIKHPWITTGPDIEFRSALPKDWKRFECKKCGAHFVRQIPSAVCRCMKCPNALIAKGYQESSLPPYSKIKLSWIRHPLEWEDSIKKRRQIANTTFNEEEGRSEGGEIRMKDSFGNNLGKMPDIVSI